MAKPCVFRTRKHKSDSVHSTAWNRISSSFYFFLPFILPDMNASVSRIPKISGIKGFL